MFPHHSSKNTGHIHSADSRTLFLTLSPTACNVPCHCLTGNEALNGATLISSLNSDIIFAIISCGFNIIAYLRHQGRHQLKSPHCFWQLVLHLQLKYHNQLLGSNCSVKVFPFNVILLPKVYSPTAVCRLPYLILQKQIISHNPYLIILLMIYYTEIGSSATKLYSSLHWLKDFL